MGQNAFLERYEKPNYRLHAVIFVVIVAVSVFLSTQVEKSKEKTSVAAFKTPVPIDSVTLNDKTPDTQVTPRVKPSVTKAPVAEPQNSDAHLATRETESDNAFEDRQSDVSAADQLAANKAPGQKDNNLAEINSSDDPANNSETDEHSAEPLEEVFDQQHDRFLQTLAKTADIESRESAEVRKIKQAIRQDKPLSSASAADSSEATQKKQGSSSQHKPTPKTAKAATQTAKRGSQPPSPRHVSGEEDQAVPVAMRRSQPVTPPASRASPSLTTKDLNRILSSFTNSYNKGNIGQLMALFDDNASTNDRSSKRGIQADYVELFNNTQSRKLMINDVNWRVRQGKAEGAATFEVVVQPKNSTQANRIRGRIQIVAEKNAQGVYITRLVHNVQQ